MMRAFSIILILSIQAYTSSSKLYPYVSPGLKIGISKHSITITPKVSVGINTYLTDEIVFINITYGRNIFLKEKIQKLKNGYRFLETEIGMFDFNEICFGGGIGFPITGKREIITKLSFFGGYIAFLRTDHVFYESTVFNDFGLIIVAPIGSIITIWD